MFKMFKSDSGKNLLFKDSTKCLQKVPGTSFEQFLGEEYKTAISSLRQCSKFTSGSYHREFNQDKHLH